MEERLSVAPKQSDQRSAITSSASVFVAPLAHRIPTNFAWYFARKPLAARSFPAKMLRTKYMSDSLAIAWTGTAIPYELLRGSSMFQWQSPHLELLPPPAASRNREKSCISKRFAPQSTPLNKSAWLTELPVVKN
jgi:hypothetical protein